MSLSKYNRDRPFLVVTRHAKPSEGQKTETKDWLKDGKWKVEESVLIVDRVTDKHINLATVIVDIFKRSLVKNRFTESDSEEVIKHYLKEYSNYIVDGIDVWMKKSTANIKDAKDLITDLEDELGKDTVEKLNNITVDVQTDIE